MSAVSGIFQFVLISVNSADVVRARGTLILA
jgi:hypothetical protein